MGSLLALTLRTTCHGMLWLFLSCFVWYWLIGGDDYLNESHYLTRMKDASSIQICMSHWMRILFYALVSSQATHHFMLFLFVLLRWNKSQTHCGLSCSMIFWQALLFTTCKPLSNIIINGLQAHRGRSWFIYSNQLQYQLTLSKWFYLWVYAAPVRFFSDDNHSKQIYCTWSKRVILVFVLHFSALIITSNHVSF